MRCQGLTTANYDPLSSSRLVLCRALLALLAIVPSVAGCASTEAARRNNDPFEPLNRVTFGFNTLLDDIVLKPMTGVYTTVLPEFVREPISNFFNNITYVHVILNDFLQGKVDRGFADMGRLVINSTLGIAGLFDPATDLGLPAHEQNFGVTMGVWGFDQGPYIVLPFIGPTTLSGLPDIPMQIFANPVYYVDSGTTKSVLGGVGAVDAVSAARPELDELRKAVNPYIFVREGYRQRQRYLISGQAAGEDGNLFPEPPPVLEEDVDEDDNGKKTEKRLKVGAEMAGLIIRIRK